MELKEEYIELFETYLKNLGLKSVTYQKHLLYFKHFREMFGGFMTQKSIDSFLQQKTSPNHKSMVQHLIDFLKREIALDSKDVLEINKIGILRKVGRKIIQPLRVLTKEEIRKVVNGCKLPSPFQTQRFKIMVLWQYTSGLRINELCNLRWEHLNYQGKSKFYEDGREKLKYQKLYITPDIAKGNKGASFYVKTDYYLEYFAFLKEWAKSSPDIVEKIKSNQCSIWKKNKTKYSKDFKEQVFNVLGFKLPDNKSTHILRHSIATHLLEYGMSLMEVKQFMRHASVKDTERYLHLVDDLFMEGVKKKYEKSESSVETKGIDEQSLK